MSNLFSHEYLPEFYGSIRFKILEDNDHFLAIEKPYGFNTHAQDSLHPGICELLEKLQGQKLFVVHRLDQTTSGVLLFAKSKSSAHLITQALSENSTIKDYLFLTDKKHDLANFIVTGTISDKPTQLKDAKIYACSEFEPESKVLTSKASSESTSKIIKNESNSLTRFKFLQNVGPYFLYQAQIETGRTHQVRLHAEAAGIKILGDTKYAGHPFARLMLHAHRLKFKLTDIKDFEIHSKFSDCDFIENYFKNTSASKFIIDELAYFKLHFNFSAKSIFYRNSKTFRVVHENPHHELWTADLYENVLWIYWYRSELPSDSFLESVKKFTEDVKIENFFVREMKNRGQAPQTSLLLDSDSNLKTWLITEDQIQYELRSNQGLSPGLFLDQADNRKWVKAHSKNLSVLNLFSYTCGFSVCAALGGANEVISVDVSEPFLQWGKKNFEINQLNPNKYEFFKQDSLIFLQACIKRQRAFDLIICDPPSFGRNKDRIWKIDKNLPELIEKIMNCLKPQGLLLFTLNFEQWSIEDLKIQIHKTLTNKKIKFEIVHPLRSSLDFEPSQASTLMKGFLIKKL